MKDHGWFASFAPVDNPRLAVVVLVENGGFGGLVAAPVAKAVYQAAFAEPQPPARPPVVEPKEADLED